MIKSVIFVEPIQLFGSHYTASSYPWDGSAGVTASLREGCVVFALGDEEEIIPFANIKRIRRNVANKQEAAKK